MRGYRCRALSVAASGHWVVPRASLALWAITLASACGGGRFRAPDEVTIQPATPPTLPGTIQGIEAEELPDGYHHGYHPTGGPLYYVSGIHRMWTLYVWGTGTCVKLRIYLGDGTTIDSPNHNLSLAYPRIDHDYRGYPGLKTVTVEGLEGCTGAAHTTITIEPKIFVIAHYPWNECFTPANLDGTPAMIRQGSTVHITSPKTGTVEPNGFANPGINFGGGFLGVGDVWLDPNGENTPAPAGYPFPGLRKNSLVLRIIQQVVQGGTDVSPVATQTGVLEFCINHVFPTDYNNPIGNHGVWKYYIEVVEAPF